MLIDRASLAPEQTLSADLVIVGAGAAGITLAKEFANTNRSVLLLEGGGFEPSARSQELYEMRFATRYSGFDREVDYATRERLRFFGGTTNHWSGWCRPLEPWDFEERSWVPGSGWPLSLAELEPWYRRAQALLKLEAFDEQLGPAPEEASRSMRLPGGDFESRVFHFSRPPRRFGQDYREELVSAPNVRLLLEANVLRFVAEEGGVSHCEVQLEDGPRIRAAGRAFVLATGGLENPRLLLLSEEAQPGRFNPRDLVGRYFMEHPHDSEAGWLATVRGPKKRDPIWQAYAHRRAYPGSEMQRKNVWMTSRACQEREGLLGVTIEVRDPKKVELNKLGEAVRDTTQALAGFPGVAGREASESYMVWTRCENAPRRESRVFLGEERDRLGQRKAVIDWRLGDLEARSTQRSFELWAAAYGATGRGRARILVNWDKPFEAVWGGAHHMGTTRMASDASAGVVDEHCRMHGLRNLWVAGSSVYPTSGVANPTFTLTALALRLAERLRGVLG